MKSNKAVNADVRRRALASLAALSASRRLPLRWASEDIA